MKSACSIRAYLSLSTSCRGKLMFLFLTMNRVISIIYYLLYVCVTNAIWHFHKVNMFYIYLFLGVVWGGAWRAVEVRREPGARWSLPPLMDPGQTRVLSLAGSCRHRHSHLLTCQSWPVRPHFLMLSDSRSCLYKLDSANVFKLLQNFIM